MKSRTMKRIHFVLVPVSALHLAFVARPMDVVMCWAELERHLKQIEDLKLSLKVERFGQESVCQTVFVPNLAHQKSNKKQKVRAAEQKQVKRFENVKIKKRAYFVQTTDFHSTHRAALRFPFSWQVDQTLSELKRPQVNLNNHNCRQMRCNAFSRNKKPF